MLDRIETANGLTDIAGVRIELIKRGTGRPLLLLHPAIGIKSADRAIEELARSFTVIAPSHPGFGRSELPRAMTTVDDLAYFYLDVMDALDLRDVVLAGVSFGGWIAAEIAIKSTERLSHLVLADAVGIKLGDREQRDIVDIFTTKQSEVDRLARLAFALGVFAEVELELPVLGLVVVDEPQLGGERPARLRAEALERAIDKESFKTAIAGMPSFCACSAARAASPTLNRSTPGIDATGMRDSRPSCTTIAQIRSETSTRFSRVSVRIHGLARSRRARIAGKAANGAGGVNSFSR